MATNYRNVQDSVETLKKKGRISAKTAGAMRQGGARRIQMPDLTTTTQDPVFSCFLIDGSGSMNICRDTVIQNQPGMLDALRGSAKCRNEALYVAQYLFNNQAEQLNPFTLLARWSGDDTVVVLDEQRYAPNGQTALYKTLYLLLQDMAAIIDHCESSGLVPQFTIGLITDGEDNVAGADPADIRRFMDELRNNNHLRSSVVLGLVNSKLTETHLESIRATIGFDKAIVCRQDNQREVRRAFVLASQSAISAQN